MQFTFRGAPVTSVRIQIALANRNIWPLPYIRSVYGPKLIFEEWDETLIFSLRGDYGRFIPDILGEISEPFLFLDIGSNIGIFSLFAETLPHCERVVAIEPVPTTFARLVRNIELNKACKIVPLCAAVANNQISLSTLRYSPTHTGGASTHVTDPTLRLAFAPKVEAQQLFCLIAGTKRIVAKIDVEGSELSVLHSLENASFYSLLTDIIIEISEKRGGISQVRALYSALHERQFEEVSKSKKVYDPDQNHYDAHFRKKVLASNRRSLVRGVTN